MVGRTTPTGHKWLAVRRRPGTHGWPGPTKVALSAHFNQPKPPGQRTAANRNCPVGELAGALDPTLVPDRAVGLVDRAVGAVDEVAVEVTGEPAVVGDREHGALEAIESFFERLGRL